MFKEVLQIIPRLSSSDLAGMERSLQGRFTKIAKNFGRGLRGVMTGGGIMAAGAALISKMLSPLKEVQEAIDRTLHKSDDIVTNAKQFGSSAGELAKLRAMGQATGLEGSQLDMLVTKFQVAVAEASADPNKDTSVRAFVGESNAVKGFFSFIQGLQKLGVNDRLRAQSEIFGEKQVGKMADFLQSDFPALLQAFAGVSVDKLNESAGKLSDLNDLKDLITAQQDLADINNKAKVINRGQILEMGSAQQKQLDRENKRIADFKGLLTIDERLQSIQAKLETLVNDVVLKIPALFTALDKALDLLSKAVDGWRMIFDLLKDSPLIRGIFRKGK